MKEGQQIGNQERNSGWEVEQKGKRKKGRSKGKKKTNMVVRPEQMKVVGNQIDKEALSHIINAYG